MKYLKKFSLSLLLILLLIISLSFLLPARTPYITGANSVATIEKVILGGVEQFILIRGRDVSNPILLFLHGGPGYSQISYARKYQKGLEEDFIVVNWDQRGSGKSYSRNIPKETMTRDQLIEDTKELIDYLCDTYDKDKIYLIGHSWGSELGIFVVDKYPERIEAYIGIGQVVNGLEGEMISYEYAMEKAKEDNNKRAIRELNAIGTPPYKTITTDTNTQRKWLARYGGVERQVNTLKDIFLCSIFAPEYTGMDGIRMAIGSKFSFDNLWGSHYSLNLIELIPEVKVPIYFCVGRYEYTIPSQLAEQYYESIIAPSKELYWFENSSHFPHFEEVEKFEEIMKRIKQDKFSK